MKADFRQSLSYAALGVVGILLAGYPASIALQPEGPGTTPAVRILCGGISVVLAAAALAHCVMALALATGRVDSVERSGATVVLKKGGEVVARGRIHMAIKLAGGVGGARSGDERPDGDEVNDFYMLFICGWRPYLCHARTFLREG